MTAAPERHEFQAETARLLKLMAHSVYSEKEVFLRELISNAADACDKLRYKALSTPELVKDGDAFQVRITADKDARTLSIADNGIGMDKDDLIAHLGTIAKSGTADFVAALENGADANQIGQFGVGFYSAFIVADKVEVTTRKAGDETVWLWSSTGDGSYDIAEAPDRAEKLSDGRGAVVTLHLNKEADEFLEKVRLQHIVKSYSDHIPLPVFIEAGGEEAAQANSAGALWTRPKSEISDEDYKDFYAQVLMGYDEPSKIIHYKAEGRHEYSVLLYVPTMAPFDLFDPARKAAVKLYVKRVAITDEAGLLPPYLRFVRGIVDSEDMPLNISREMLQNNPIVAAIRSALTKRVISELSKTADKDKDAYGTLWETFGPVLKEGVYEDMERREALLDLARFKTTTSDGAWRTLDDYIAAMPEGQEAIYYIHGDNAEAIAASPQLEGYRARGVEVLLLSDPVDGFWPNAVMEAKGKPLRSVTSASADDLKDLAPAEKKDEAPAVNDADLATLIAAFKTALGDKVADVRGSDRLTESPACLVAADGAVDLAMQRMMGGGEGPKVLEVNPSHAIVTALADAAGTSEGKGQVENVAHILYEQSRIASGDAPSNAPDFAKRITDLLTQSLKGAGTE